MRPCDPKLPASSCGFRWSMRLSSLSISLGFMGLGFFCGLWVFIVEGFFQGFGVYGLGLRAFWGLGWGLGFRSWIWRVEFTLGLKNLHVFRITQPYLLVGYHGEPKVQLFHNIRIILGLYYPKRLKATYSTTRPNKEPFKGRFFRLRQGYHPKPNILNPKPQTLKGVSENRGP